MRAHIVILLLFWGTATTYAQGQLSLQLSPGLSINRVFTNPNNTGFSSARKALCYKLGVLYDYPIQDRYYVSTGLYYTSQHLALSNAELSPAILETHMLQFLQLPLLLKLYTSEFKLDTRLYVVLGLLGQVKFRERNTELPKGQKQSFLGAFRRWSSVGLLGIGIEHNTSLSTSIFGGISYHRGLSSVINKKTQAQPDPQVMGYCDMFSLDLGIRF
ncbi:MAG: outer membrane beta-barrel protein [Bacteroidota bacterium]